MESLLSKKGVKIGGWVKEKLFQTSDFCYTFYNALDT